MSRLSRFEDFRWVGDRDAMMVYDTDDEVQAATLRSRVESAGLVPAGLVQTFGPDTLAEARNRGFTPVVG